MWLFKKLSPNLFIFRQAWCAALENIIALQLLWRNQVFEKCMVIYKGDSFNSNQSGYFVILNCIEMCKVFMLVMKMKFSSMLCDQFLSSFIENVFKIIFIVNTE